MDENNIVWIEAGKLQPSQFYINKDSIEILRNNFDSILFEPVPVKIIGQDIVITDGHTRTCYLIEKGFDYIPTTEEKDELDWEAYIINVKDCKERGVFSAADLDSFMKEGILEWIQVLPEYRGKGIGTYLVNELLIRMKGKAKFATVSGDCNNINNPIKLYRKCGFVDNSIWYIAYEN